MGKHRGDYNHMNCKDCIKKQDCRWLSGVHSALIDLMHTDRYGSGVAFNATLFETLPMICRGFEERKEGE